ncbi:TIGR02594 family protein [Bradyrhizobium jicamae]|uniref:TIGR02594 family protein n=1 Tax=Bradyrhizobium jicamae TaxID=280332 RepID=UPI001BA8E35A|nr:TIGR02594 family protein [Bradyrhizobium jicamae]MBR0754895.1 TIGR02594 family protein [Bradyrhizobium jicamae]
MVQLVAFCRSLRLIALALCSVTLVVSAASPASARPHGRHARATHAGHHARQYVHHHYRNAARLSRWERGVAQMQTQGLGNANATVVSTASVVPNTGGVTFTDTAASIGGFGSSLVSEARRYLGGNPTGRGSLWCARFMNLVLQHTGHKGTGSDMASSFASYGQRISGPQVGAIAVMSRGRGGGHVGIITGIDAKGNPIMISGNNGNRVREAPISRGRIYAYVMPN